EDCIKRDSARHLHSLRSTSWAASRSEIGRYPGLGRAFSLPSPFFLLQPSKVRFPLHRRAIRFWPALALESSNVRKNHFANHFYPREHSLAYGLFTRHGSFSAWLEIRHEARRPRTWPKNRARKLELFLFGRRDEDDGPRWPESSSSSQGRQAPAGEKAKPALQLPGDHKSNFRTLSRSALSKSLRACPPHPGKHVPRFRAGFSLERQSGHILCSRVGHSLGER